MMNCVVLGAGESGVGAALLAKEKGINVFVSDFSVIQENFAQELIQANIEYEQQKHSLEKIYEADIIVKSPGIPDHIPLIQDAIQKGIEVVSEIEFASRYCQTPIIAITGSNGKTTTTALIHHLFKESGLTSKIGGNYGISFARLLLENDLPDVFVLEISSFQLDGINSFKPKIAIVLNISADHLDRYQYEILNYAKAKMRITANQDSSDTFIYNSNDELTKTLLNENPTDAQLIPVAELIDELNDLDGSPIKNNNKLLKYTHNRFNAQCAIYAACSFGVKPEHIESQLNSFEGEAHRMELVKR